MESLLALLAEHGLLLAADPRLPSVATVVAGEPIAGSWWGHPKGSAIYNALNWLEDQPDVRSAKLLKGKVTLVHRRLWPALAAVGRGKEAWQLRGLPEDALDLLARVEAAGSLRLDALPPPYAAWAKPAGLLEARLLVQSEQLHTEGGKHVRVLKAWERSALTAAQGREVLESLVERRLLPWAKQVPAARGG